MTQDDLENAFISGARLGTFQRAESNPDGPDTRASGVKVSFEITDENWDAAKASAADALVLVQWLESKGAE